MARLWHTGFEWQSTTAAMEWQTTTGTVSISTSTVRSGAASLRCNPSAATGFIYQRYRADATSIVYYRFYFYVATMPSANCQIFAHSDDLAAIGPGIRLANDGTLTAVNTSASQIGGTTTVTTGNWYRVDFSYDDDTNQVRWFLDGRDISGGSIAAGDLAGGGALVLGPSTASSTIDIFFDDLAVNDGSTSSSLGYQSQQSYPGPGKIIMLLPNGDGSDKQWQSSASSTQGTSTFGAVDEVTPNDATDYNRRTTNSPTATPADLWHVENPSTKGVRPHDLVKVLFNLLRAGATNTTATGRTLEGRIYYGGGTVYEGTAEDISVNGWTTIRQDAPRVPSQGIVQYEDIDTAGLPLSILRLDSAQAGYQAGVSSTNEIRVSQVCLMVDFQDAPQMGQGQRHNMPTISRFRSSYR